MIFLPHLPPLTPFSTPFLTQPATHNTSIPSLQSILCRHQCLNPFLKSQYHHLIQIHHYQYAMQRLHIEIIRALCVKALDLCHPLPLLSPNQRTKNVSPTTFAMSSPLFLIYCRNGMSKKESRFIATSSFEVGMGYP